VHSKKTADDEAVAEVAEKVQQDIDEAFEATVKRAIKPIDKHEEPEKPTMDDSNRTFRTRLLTVWLFTNAMLSLVITRLGANGRVRYFQAILWTTFLLSSFR
jgi:chitin synthase